MSTAVARKRTRTVNRTLADLVTALGDVPLDRIRIPPWPGVATEKDILEIEAREGLLYELVDGVLVQKGMAYYESVLACVLIRYISEFVDPRKLGLVTGESGMVRLFPGLVRIPDVAFASWKRFPKGRKRVPIPHIAPDLAVEVLSESNTTKEMARKLREYFKAGVLLVWIIDPDDRTVEVYTSPSEPDEVLGEKDTLTGGNVLPGFSLRLKKLFSKLDDVEAE